MVGLIRCLGYFSCENTVFKRSHSSEKCVQDDDKRCARSSIVLSNPFYSDCRQDSDSIRVDLNWWVLRTPLSLFVAIDSMPRNAFGFHREFYGGMCFVKCVQEVTCSFYIGHDGQHIFVSLPSRSRFSSMWDMKILASKGPARGDPIAMPSSLFVQGCIELE